MNLCNVFRFCSHDVPAIGRRLLTLALAAVFLLTAACENPEERAAGHIATAEKLLEEGNIVKADLEARNALQIEPRNADARFLLARIAESRGDFSDMAANLRAAIELQPDFLDARVRLGTIYVLGGALELAQQQLAEAQRIASDDVLVKILDARVLAAMGNLDAASRQLRAVLEEDSANAQALGLLANILAATDLQAAIALVDQGIPVIEDNRALRLLRIQLLEASGDEAAAESAYKALISDYPDQVAYVYQLARVYAAAGRQDDVEQLLQELIRNRPDDMQAKLALVQFVGGTRGPEASIELLQEFLAGSPDAHELRLVLGQIFQAGDRPAEAVSEFETVIRRAGNEDVALSAKSRLAAIRLGAGETESGEKLVEEVLAMDAQNSEALLLRGAINFDADQLRAAVSDLRSLLRTDPDNLRAQLLLARTHAKAGDDLLAKDAYRRVLELRPGLSTATLELVRLLLKDGDLAGAERLLTAQLAATPDDVTSVRALVAVLLNRQRYDDAERQASALAARPGQAAAGEFLLGGIYQQRQQPDKAIDAFRRSLDAQPAAREPLQGYVGTLLQQGRVNEARDYLEVLTREQPENLFARTLLGQVLAGSGELTAAAQIFETTLSEDQSWLPAYTALAGLQGADRGAQIDIYKRGLEAVPGSQELALLLGTAYERNGQIDDAIAAYENALQANPDMQAVANNLAALLADYRQDRASFQRALELSQGFAASGNPAFLDTLGWVYYRLGDYARAEPLLQEAVSLAGQVPVLRYHLGMNYYALGKNKLAIEELAAATRDDAGSYPGREEAAEVLGKLTAAN